MRLSTARAETVRKVLQSQMNTVDDAKIVSVGKGESEPIADNGNHQGRAKNRRVEIKIFRDTKIIETKTVGKGQNQPTSELPSETSTSVEESSIELEEGILE